eukprot:GHVR01106331.1.p1 GENE.GHVR01106331.1~~GHVR01106331.1.p1  ORF type:complete len:220 (-),score=41.54 GHVR01106331.1:179-838(-)
MKYGSTRGGVCNLSFIDAVMSGLAADGGLLVPANIPIVSFTDIQMWREYNYLDLCYNIMRCYVDPTEINDDDLGEIIQLSYSKYSHQDIAPVVNIDSHTFVLELFHGPTLSFKDFALQFLGNLYEHILIKLKSKAVIVGATSGDTGSAAIAGFEGKYNVSCVVLFPHNKVSAIQQRQMTTRDHSQVHCIAIRGDFDDCQAIVKRLFSSELKHTLSLGRG